MIDIGRQKDLIIFTMTLFIAAYIGYTVVYKNNKRELEGIKAKIEEEKKKNEVLDMINALNKKQESYRVRAFSSTEITPLVGKLSELAKQVNIPIETFTPGTLVRRDEYTGIALKVPLKCSYHKLGKFLSLVESNKQFIRVEAVTVSKAFMAGPTGVRQPKIEVSLSGFYLP